MFSSFHPKMKLTIIVSIGILFGVECVPTGIVQTSKGQVRGEIFETSRSHKKYSSFLGLPYAKPPLERLRFMPPVEIDAWSDVFNATKLSASCPEQASILGNHTYIGSENCLYLNVYTPKTDFTSNNDEKKAVIVWIRGYLDDGYQHVFSYGPDYMLENDVVFVTFNYRLGLLGFLTLDHENATGNAGLKDQTQVLLWIKENIAHFGGDPNRVTIFGHNSGATHVDLHVLSEMSQGLFHAAISMSNSALGIITTVPHAEYRQLVLNHVKEELNISAKNDAEVLEQLYTVPPSQLVQGKKYDLNIRQVPGIVERTDIGNDKTRFLTKCASAKYERGNFTKVPYIIGYTKDEHSISAGAIAQILDSVMKKTQKLNGDEEWKKLLFDPIVNQMNVSLQNIIKSEYVQVEIQDLVKELFIKSPLRVTRDYLVANSDQPVYVYQFSYETQKKLYKKLVKNNDVVYTGAATGEDLPYLLNIEDALESSNEVTIKSRQMVEMWTNFAKYHNPTPVKKSELLREIEWNKADQSKNYLNIDRNITMKIDSSWNLIDIFTKYLSPVHEKCSE